jgi:hypothetical protein
MMVKNNDFILHEIHRQQSVVSNNGVPSLRLYVKPTFHHTSVTGSSVYTYNGLYPPYYLYVKPTFHHMSVTGSSVSVMIS